MKGLSRQDIFLLINAKFTLKENEELVFLLYTLVHLLCDKQAKANKPTKKEPCQYEVRLRNVAIELTSPSVSSTTMKVTYLPEHLRRQLIYHFLAFSWRHLPKVKDHDSNELFVETCHKLGIDPFKQQWMFAIFTYVCRE